MRKSLAARGPRLDAIVLAAGGSSRLGRAKQLLRWRNRSLLTHALGLARNAVDGKLIVVIGAERQRLRSSLRRQACRAEIVANPGWRTGLASSLDAGLAHASRDAAGALIMLVDQPWLEARDYARLVDRWRRRPGHAAAAYYLERVGAPAIIPRRWYRTVRQLGGDVGARHLLRALGDVGTVAMPAAGFDVDTEADAIRLRAAARPSGVSGA